MKRMDDFKTWAVKILLPSFVGISIKLAVQAKKVTWFNVITSVITGIGTAHLLAGPVLSSVPEHWGPVAIASVAISGEKIGLWLVYKFNIEGIADAIYNNYFKVKK